MYRLVPALHFERLLQAEVIILSSMIILVLTASGCGDGHLPRYPVEGKVTFSDGTPLKGGAIAFESKATENGLPLNARAPIQADGTFRLTTFDLYDGAVAGEHRVVVVSEHALKPEPEELPKGQRRVPVKYQRYDKSGLHFTVTEGKNEFQIVLESE